MTTYGTFDIDTVPAPSDLEIADWPGFDVQPTTRCGYRFYCQLRNVNNARPYLWQWIEDRCEPTSSTRIYSVARWDALLAQYEHELEAEMAQDERETITDVRYAGAV